MTADELIDVLEQQALLPPDAIVTLRQFVIRSLKIVTPESLAKLLIDKRWLSPAQAKRLLKEEAIKAAAPIVDDLGLAPLDEPPEKRYGSGGRRAAEASRPASAPPAATVTPTVAAKPGKLSAGKSDGAHASTDTRAPDDLFGESNLVDALAGLDSSVLTAAPRRSKIPTWVWAATSGGWVLLVAIAATAILLGRSNGDSEWQLAEKDYSAAADQRAIAELDAFLEQFPDHPRAPTAAVYRGVARLRDAVTKANWETSLAIAGEDLPQIVDLPDFTNVRDALAKLLPQVATGLARQAQEGAKGSLDRRRRQVDAALLGLALAKDPRYTADSQRPWALLKTTEGDVALLARAVDRETELNRATGEIRSALASGHVTAAVARRDQLLDGFPELQQDTTVEALDQELAQAEAATLKHDQPRQAP
jgi:hypothetical protein